MMPAMRVRDVMRADLTRRRDLVARDHLDSTACGGRDFEIHNDVMVISLI